MRVANAAATIQRSYEAGDISYPRSSARSMGAAGSAAVRSWGFEPQVPIAPGPAAAGRRPHEAVHVLAASLPGLLGGVPQHLLPQSGVFLDRLARANVRAVTPLPIERPDLRALPEWARDLDWWRPAASFPTAARSAADGCDVSAQPALFDFDAEEVAFETLVREGLARPSSISEHAARAAERGFFDATGLAPAGLAALVDMPPSLMMPGLAHAVEAVIEADAGDAAAGPPADLVAGCFRVMPELAPRLRAALSGDEGKGKGDLAPAHVEQGADRAAARLAGDREWSYWARRRRGADGVDRKSTRQDLKPPQDIRQAPDDDTQPPGRSSTSIVPGAVQLADADTSAAAEATPDVSARQGNCSGPATPPAVTPAESVDCLLPLSTTREGGPHPAIYLAEPSETSVIDFDSEPEENERISYPATGTSAGPW